RGIDADMGISLHEAGGPTWTPRQGQCPSGRHRTRVCRTTDRLPQAGRQVRGAAQRADGTRLSRTPQGAGRMFRAGHVALVSNDAGWMGREPLYRPGSFGRARQPVTVPPIPGAFRELRWVAEGDCRKPGNQPCPRVERKLVTEV